MATPSAAYSVPTPHDPAHLSRGYGDSSHLDIDANDFATTPSHPQDSSPLSQSYPQPQRYGRFEEDFDAKTRGSSVLMDDSMQRSASRASTLNQGATPSRSGTLKKKNSVKRSASLKRSGSRSSKYAGSIRGVSTEDNERGSSKHNNVFFTPVPTSGSPTEILANRFQAWRKFLKDLITYFREIQGSYEHRAKALLKVSNVISNTNAPAMFMTDGGLNEANRILRDYHKQAVMEATKAREVQTEVINQLSGLRADLGQKIKEIKSLSGDFKNSVEKEKEITRKCVAALEEALSLVDTDPSAGAGKGDPYVVRLGVDRQVEKQIDEENYLHRAYLNLENSGRELESIVIGEIQKAYNAYAGILKKEADESYKAVDSLRTGPIAMPRDSEWNEFVLNDAHFVNPNIPLRRLEDIEYPGKHHPATTEVRAGMLERKSKYLKSYTPGWYVLSPTHLHEFKSADRIYTQPPVMSLYLLDQKLGTHSQLGSSSHKFVLKGRQAGSMHRGHNWVFRAETFDTMMAWYEDIKTLTEKTGEERNAFVRLHTRSVSQSSNRSVSSDGGLEEDDEADAIPYSANQSTTNAAVREEIPHRPSPGGRFPSDINVERNLHAPLSPSSGSSEIDNDLTTASGGIQSAYSYPSEQPTPYPPYQLQQQDQTPQASQNANSAYPPPAVVQNQTSYYPYSDPAQSHVPPAQPMSYASPQAPPQETSYAPVQPTSYAQEPVPVPFTRHDSNYGSWMAPVAGAAGGAAAGALGADAYRRHRENQEQSAQEHLPNEASHPGPVPEQPNVDPTVIPVAVPISQEPGGSVENTPSTVPTSENDQAFIDKAEVAPAASSTKPAEGGGVFHETGHIFPSVLRHNTDVSVSDLHVPGEYRNF
ncbi:hypothetical protein P154DRAFT_419475 [Amniculicola lignicola CBS 123094]|uniref:PH domain-containing protein n=1 Tax=Amniculicola lignicola CBS 123094 TaxID=1392246 RepID=A0A6A5X562_9PLEO|nr:hypothetical protein P154DRAFT_419475 [Amniculicola lignicola CBS 123094]